MPGRLKALAAARFLHRRARRGGGTRFAHARCEALSRLLSQAEAHRSRLIPRPLAPEPASARSLMLRV